MKYELQTYYIMKKLFPKKKKQVNEIPHQNTYYFSDFVGQNLNTTCYRMLLLEANTRLALCPATYKKMFGLFILLCVCACTCVNLSSGSYMSAMQSLQWPYYYECEYILFVQQQPLNCWMAFRDYTTRQLRNYLPFIISFKFKIISPLLLSNSSLLLLQFCVGSN